MLVLLASMFFSGFMFPLLQILVPVRYIGYLLPVTYSIINLQNVMLKGIPPPTLFLVALSAMGVGLFVFSWWRYRRSMIRA
jgi:ABC-2 type transport system permease protein